MRRNLLLLIVSAVVTASAVVGVSASAEPVAAPPDVVDPAPAPAPRLARGLIVKANSDAASRRASIARTVRRELPAGATVASTVTTT
ncbi:hypothetical protein [Aeromicrobium duanguangcaii]|uniref:Uncharacterized protein n=1 Tax=Aeromicrobium duanguangcaii TaxID=2968086 RepID=A0ABY5KGN6_9ACTN|nr:hypothetical protein [Aeromicrobium duanguangcaii]MCD9153921.1 hypothetical protein [Aeromicrobium duanguangcaii]UUI69000.1 hypothetical protein NP095_02505 [Aeromicrobium duanguangcaii]